MAMKPIDACRLAIPLAGVLAAWLLARWYIAPGADLDAMTRGMIGPATWPRAALYCTGAFAAAIFVRNLRAYLAPRTPARTPGASPALDEWRTGLGTALIIAYAAVLPVIGVAWATLAFLAAWMVLGGLRRAGLIAAVAGCGTIAILFLFVKASHMPLDRGTGGFEQATVALYRVLHIY